MQRVRRFQNAILLAGDLNDVIYTQLRFTVAEGYADGKSVFSSKFEYMYTVTAEVYSCVTWSSQSSERLFCTLTRDDHAPTTLSGKAETKSVIIER